MLRATCSPRQVLVAPQSLPVSRPLAATRRFVPRTQRARLSVLNAAAAAPPAPAAPDHLTTVVNTLAAKPEGTIMVAQIAPAVRVAISEMFDLPSGAVSVGQIVTGLRQLGFDYVFDVLTGADLTIMEEGTELLHRLHVHLLEQAGQQPAEHGHGPIELPMFTSCCPGWVQLVEKSYPELIPHVSTCKSPQMMMGAVVKNCFAKDAGVEPKDIQLVSIMPCVRKQGEADRPTNNTTADPNVRDIDHVLTTAQLGDLFKARGINLPELPETQFNTPVGIGSGAGQIFGTTGGVMEAALRTVYEVVTEQRLDRIVFEACRGLEGVKEASITMHPGPNSEFKDFDKDGTGITVNIAVANGLGAAKKLLKDYKEGKVKYDFVEVMACPGGCIQGAGQPRSKDPEIAKKRQQSIYTLDERLTIRRSHDNPFVKAFYDRFLSRPNGEEAHRLLHTHYIAGGPSEK